MTEQELRELDAKVHKALYPGWRIERRDGIYSPDYRAILPGDGPNTWIKDIPLPWYSTDIRDWEEIYELKPEWRWTEYDAQPVNAATVMLLTERTVFSADVLESEAHGLAAYALGRARCVLAWANMNAVDEGDDRHEHGPTDQIGAE